METKFKVVTKHTKQVLLDFIAFRNQIKAPRATFQIAMMGMCFYTLTLIVLPEKYYTAAIILAVIGTLFMALAFGRKYISLAQLKKVDKHYEVQDEIVFEFGNGGFDVIDELNGTQHYRYSDVDVLYKDKKYYYIGTKEDDLFLIARNEIVAGSAEEFEGFIARKTGVKVKLTKLPLKEQIEMLFQARDIVYEERKKKKEEKKTKK